MSAAHANGHATQYAPPAATSALARANHGVEPTTMAELKDFAKMAADSHFFGVETPQQALILAMAGKDLGFSYTQALRAFHVIKGKPSLTADGMVAVCLQADACEHFEPVEQSATRAVWETKRRGRPAVRQSFTIEEARAAGLTDQNGAMWKKYPQRMLSARCKAYLARDVFPELLMGLVSEDEAVEIAQSREPTRVQTISAEVVESRVVEPVTEHIATQIADRMSAATSVKELTSIAAEVKNAMVNDSERAFLRDLFAERRAALTPPAPTPAREPGEEG